MNTSKQWEPNSDCNSYVDTKSASECLPLQTAQCSVSGTQRNHRAEKEKLGLNDTNNINRKI